MDMVLFLALEKVGGGDEQSWIESPECKRMRSNSLVLDSEGPRFDPGEMHFSEISAGLADEVSCNTASDGIVLVLSYGMCFSVLVLSQERDVQKMMFSGGCISLSQQYYHTA